MADSAGFEADQLLAQVGWVRQLARSLISDPDLADDVAQEAWLAALKSAPDRDRPLEPWLATVVRNFALRARRSASRRAAREEVAATPEALPSASELYERASMHKELVQAVLALEEPYKTTLLLRFLEELPPRSSVSSD
jgi:RNA polymerase sigma factor (sigma-70 family)